MRVYRLSATVASPRGVSHLKVRVIRTTRAGAYAGGFRAIERSACYQEHKAAATPWFPTLTDLRVTSSTKL